MKDNLTLFLFLFFSSAMAQSTTKDIVYAGTFSERDSKGIYVFEFDRIAETLTEVQTVSDRESPTYLEVHPSGKFLYVVYREKPEHAGTIAAFQIDAMGKLAKINEQPVGKNPCHISIDPQGKLLFVSNYASGSLIVYSIKQDGSLSPSIDNFQYSGSSLHKERQKEPHTHSAIPSLKGDFLYVSDLGVDKIMLYEIDAKGNLYPAKTPFIETPPGAGPRHSVVHPNGNYLFSNEELTSSVTSYKIDQRTGALQFVERVTMLSNDTTAEGNSAADIHLSPDGEFLYASNRGQDNLVVYRVNSNNGKLSYVEHTRTEGKHPRSFMVDDKGEFIFVANRFTDSITLFRRDLGSGRLVFTGKKFAVPGIVCVKQLTYTKVNTK